MDEDAIEDAAEPTGNETPGVDVDRTDDEPDPNVDRTDPAGDLTCPARIVRQRPKRRRPPPGRISPEALAARRGGAVEGLAWLGRPPEAKASLTYRFLRLVGRFAIFGLFRFKIRTSGREHLPRGGYFLVAAAHRGWMDPFVVMHAIPTQPRAWFLGSAPSTFTSPLAGAAHPSRRWPAPGLARRRRDRPARRLGEGRHRQRGCLRPDARGHGERPAGPDRAVPCRLGGHRAADRRRRSCRWRWPAPRSSTSGGGWRRRSFRPPRSVLSPGSRRGRASRRRLA